ncbi:MAG: hypothetical protein WBI01_00585 [Syntrophomonadaceae bacterium]
MITGGEDFSWVFGVHLSGSARRRLSLARLGLDKFPAGFVDLL